MPQGGTLTIRTRQRDGGGSRAFCARRLPPGEYVLMRSRRYRHRHRRRTSWTRSASRSSRPRRSARAPASGSRPSMASSSRPAASSSATASSARARCSASICRAISPGRGTQPEARRRRAPTSSAPISPARARILLVEDEDAVRAFASRALASRGYKVLEAAPATRRWRSSRRRAAKIDLVVSDVVMPEMDGPTLLKELRKRGITDQDHLHLRLCRGRLREEPARGREISPSCRSRSR